MFGNWTFGTLVFTVMVITVTLKVNYTDPTYLKHFLLRFCFTHLLLDLTIMTSVTLFSTMSYAATVTNLMSYSAVSMHDMFSYMVTV